MKNKLFKGIILGVVVAGLLLGRVIINGPEPVPIGQYGPEPVPIGMVVSQ